jgi:glycosyltransferase involved in cell wall biosynthesis
MAAMLGLRLLRGRPSLVTTHGLHFLRRARGLALAAARRRLRAASRAADRVVCTSAAERRELEQLLGEDAHGRLAVVPNGIPLPAPVEPQARAAARAGLGLADGDVAVLYLGQLEPRKDPLTAVAAARRARAEGAAVSLLVAGDGPLAGAVQRQAGEAVWPLGRRDDPETLLAAADVLVLPSRREGMSMAVLEAMARGIPAVVSDAPGNPETVGDAGVVVAGGDSNALATALAGLAGDPGRRRRLGAAGRARVAGELSAERMVAATRALYEEALERTRGR